MSGGSSSRVGVCSVMPDKVGIHPGALWSGTRPADVVEGPARDWPCPGRRLLFGGIGGGALRLDDLVGMGGAASRLEDLVGIGGAASRLDDLGGMGGVASRPEDLGGIGGADMLGTPLAERCSASIAEVVFMPWLINDAASRVRGNTPDTCAMSDAVLLSAEGLTD